jgi:hypothetical protein
MPQPADHKGMISPFGPPFVDPATGRLSAVSFRFLYELHEQINELLRMVEPAATRTGLAERLDDLEARLRTLEGLT